EPDLADRVGLARRAALAAQRGQERLQAFDLGVVPLLRTAHAELPLSASPSAEAVPGSPSADASGYPSLARRAAARRSCFRARRSLTACSRFSFSNVCRDFFWATLRLACRADPRVDPYLDLIHLDAPGPG